MRDEHPVDGDRTAKQVAPVAIGAMEGIHHIGRIADDEVREGTLERVLPGNAGERDLGERLGAGAGSGVTAVGGTPAAATGSMAMEPSNRHGNKLRMGHP